MKNYTKELIRKTDFPDYTTFTCLNNQDHNTCLNNQAYQDFIFKLSEVIDLFGPSKKSRLKASSKPWIDSDTISTIRRRDKRSKKYKRSGLETEKDHFRSAKMALQKAISKKEKSYFQEKIGKNTNNSMELWKNLKSLGMKSGKVNHLNIVLKKDGAIQFEPTKNANTFKDFYPDLADNVIRKLPDVFSNFNNNLTKQYYMNVEKNCRNFELCTATLETIKKIF